jgi:hypothetical protein
VPRSFASRAKVCPVNRYLVLATLVKRLRHFKCNHGGNWSRADLFLWKNNERVVLERLTEQPALILLAYYVAEIQQPSSAGRGIYAQLPFSYLIDV